MKKITIILISSIFITVIICIFQNNNKEIEIKEDNTNTISTVSNNISNDIKIIDLDGKKTNYAFNYNDKVYKAIYTYDNWRIIDSYEITNNDDMLKICQALIDIHKIHGSDMVSYRTAGDMVNEWIQHNLAYTFLPEDSPWKKHAKDVDLNPQDQGKNFIEIYKQRIKKNKFDI